MKRLSYNLDSSEIGGLPATSGTHSRAIGLLLGERGSVITSSNTETGLPRVPAVAAAEVMSDPEIIDRPESLGLLRQYIRKSIWRDIYTSSSGWDGYRAGYEITSDVPTEAAEEARNRWKAFRQLCAPLRADDILRELTRLMVNSAKRQGEDIDTQIILETWLDDLSDYPADIVLWAFGFWRRNEKFWPTWCEFKALLDRRVEQRRAIMSALEEIGRRAVAGKEETHGKELST